MTYGPQSVLIAHGLVYLSFIVYILFTYLQTLNSLSTETKKRADFANSSDLDEVTHNETPPLDLHCLLSSL